MIGDPGGKDAERNFLGEEILAYNVASIQSQVVGIMDNIQSVTGEKLKVSQIVNNADFYTEMSFL
jgi:tyrosyl-tRNA synthetase